MMKEIILIRHATAEAQDVENDLSRKLVSKGLKESLNVGLFLAKLRKEVDIILISHADRAVETADQIQSIVYRKIKRKIDMDLYSGGVDDYLKVIHKLEDNHQNVLIIGHNPVLKELAAYFANSNSAGISFPKASIYGFSFDSDQWQEVENAHSQLSFFINRESIESVLSHTDEKKIFESIKKLYSTTQKLLKRAKREGFNMGITHDIRIMNRRWLSLTELSGCDSEALKTAIDTVMQTTGKYRDRCVQTKILKKTNPDRSIYNYWKKKKTKQKKQLAKTLGNKVKEDFISPYTDYYQKISNEIERLSDFEMKRDIQESLDQLKINSHLTLEDNKTELHEFRLKTKDIRYKIEFYQETNTGDAFQAELEKLIFLQKSLGKMRDYEKLIKKITKQSKRFDNEEIQDTVLNIQKLLQEKWREISNFLENNPDFTI
jgi:phosphohistidine phosphatase